jgi:ubiquinone/menaquinone biosynthesis C-methylase UbiE
MLYDELLFGPVMRGFHGGPWYNVGLWTGCAHAEEACGALAARVAARVVRSPHRVLDVGCGIGGSTGALQQRWQQAVLVGVGISRPQLAHARTACAGARFVCADAVALPFANAAFDAVIAIESALHFDPRTRFFAEARRVLAPGGTLALSDLLAPSAAWPGSWSIPGENLGLSVARYAQELAGVGFASVCIDDVTAATWTPYLARFSAYVDALPDDTRMAWRASAQALREGEQPVYVVASAVTPRA